MRALLVLACAALRVACGAVCRACNRVAADRLGAGECARMVPKVVLGGVVLAACRQPNRRCGRGGAGARTAAESDEAPSRPYVRLGLVLRALLVRACAAWRVTSGAVCRACDRVAADRLGAGECARMVPGVVLEGVVLAACREPNRRCGRGGAGALTAAESDGALSRRYVRLGLGLRLLLVRACAALRVACGAVCRARNRVAADRLGAGECACMVPGVVLEGVVLAACREPNRRCGRGGAGARTAAESDDAPSRRYVRLGLGLRALLVRACAALGCGSRVVRYAELATGWRRIAFEVAGARACCVVGGRPLAAYSL